MGKKKQAWTVEDDALIIRRYREGLPLAKIASEMGRTGNDIGVRIHHLRQVGELVAPLRNNATPKSTMQARIAELERQTDEYKSFWRHAEQAIRDGNARIAALEAERDRLREALEATEVIVQAEVADPKDPTCRPYAEEVLAKLTSALQPKEQS